MLNIIRLFRPAHRSRWEVSQALERPSLWTQPLGCEISGAVAGYEAGYFSLAVSGDFDGAEKPSLYEFIMAR